MKWRRDSFYIFGKEGKVEVFMEILHLTLKMTTAQVVETSVTTTTTTTNNNNNNSLSKDYLHPDDHTRQKTVEHLYNFPQAHELLIWRGFLPEMHLTSINSNFTGIAKTLFVFWYSRLLIPSSFMSSIKFLSSKDLDFTFNYL